MIVESDRPWREVRDERNHLSWEGRSDRLHCSCDCTRSSWQHTRRCRLDADPQEHLERDRLRLEARMTDKGSPGARKSQPVPLRSRPT
jgi:hypothetical protein